MNALNISMTLEHKNMDERIAELERLVKDQARQIEQLRNDLRNVRASHNNRILRSTAVNMRIHSR
jgi:predicted RNase H-like nuclease (RuvC/YqgF family)